MALTSAQQITQLYVGYFNRAPDPEGLNYWIGRLASGEMNVQQIAQSFSEQPETLETYPFLRYPNLLENDAQAFITEIYQNAFNRAPDAEGLKYWTQQLISGAVPVGDFIASVISGAQNTAAGQDLTTINNKTTVGLDYATQVAAANVEWTQASAHAALEGVTDAQSSVAAAQANIASFIETGAWPGSDGDTFTLTTGVDNIVGTGANDVIQGTLGGNAPTLNALDKIDGGAGSNELDLIIQGTVNAALPAGTTIKNIQTVNLVSENGAVVNGLNSGYFGSQVESVWQIGSAGAITLDGNNQTAGFRGTAAQAVTTVDGVTAATLVTENSAKGVTQQATFNGKDLSTVSVVSDAAVNVNTLGAAKVGTINLDLSAKDAAVSFDNASNNVIKTIDASASTGNLTIDTQSGFSALEALLGGSGNDKIAVSIVDSKAKTLSVDAGAGNDTIKLNAKLAQAAALEDAVAALEAAEDALDAAQAALDNASQATLVPAQEALANAEAALEAARADVAAKTAALEEAEATAADTAAALEAANANFTAATAAQTQANADLQTAQAAAAAAAAAVANAQTAANTAAAAVVTAQAAVTTAEDNVATAQQDLDAANAAVPPVQADIDTAQAALDAANTALLAANADLENAQNADVTAQAQLQVAQAAANQADIDVDQAQDAADAAADAVADAGQALQDAFDANDAADLAVTDAQGEVATAEQHATDAQVAVDTASDDVAQAEAGLAPLQKDVDLAQKDVELAERGVDLATSGLTPVAVSLTGGEGNDLFHIDGLGNVLSADDVASSLITITDFDVASDVIKLDGLGTDKLIDLNNVQLSEISSAKTLEDALTLAADFAGTGVTGFNYGGDAYILNNVGSADFGSLDGLLKVSGVSVDDFNAHNFIIA